ncbi:Crotonase superfamily,ClpP/crotonase-like domain,Crontonase, C-terminal [Cinara cedri]|uniref:Crotonase superfamily,ClpP/crotonase-like domain,Crontonase, C-terminal n=1 Tax=Cinara cedri TaxID=506608 RepID=A0A5E4M1R2_9HEMI|nr:Crotonase superfamily,ClpP/crotonase-like domain,Crontonase, C-terminal [Cinara cedri]
MSTILVNYDDSVQIISFNSPKKLNAISHQCYKEIIEALHEGAKNEDVFCTLLTGVGKTYSSGTDLFDSSDVNIEERLIVVRDFVRALIDYPKLLVALVNGHAIGIACTTLGLCDLVYATKTANFMCPFNKLGITAEGCSTITFPLIMGKTRAAELLYSGKMFNAIDAQKIGLVNEIIDEGMNGRDQLIKKIKTEIAVYKLPIVYTKSMMLNGAISKDELHRANDREYKRLLERFNSSDYFNAITNLLKQKSLKNKL